MSFIGSCLLTDLDEDVLTTVLLGLPAPRRREWIFVALTCKALYAAVLRASVVDTAEEQQALGLPMGMLNAPVDVVFPTGHRFATSIAGMLTTPLRIVYSKECLRPHEALRCTGTLLETSVPMRAREQFLRVLSHQYSQAPPEQVRARRARAESLAAYRLTTRALYHMIHLAPLHTLRASFFEVLGGNQHCALDLTLRHHRCLVFFAAMHGRIDVLDRLIHRDPSRALAYDFEKGLLPMFLSIGGEMPSTLSTSTEHASGVSYAWFGDASAGGQAERVSESQLLLARPAALHNKPQVLAWIEITQLRLQQRRFKLCHTSTRTPEGRRPNRMESSIFIGGLTLSIHSNGVGENGLRLYGPISVENSRFSTQDCELLSWRALRLLVSEAGNGAALDVLNRLWTQVIDKIVHIECHKPDQVQDECFYGAILWSILLVLLTKPRRGAVVQWMVQKCDENHGVLRAIGMQVQHLRAMGIAPDGPAPPPHTWNPRIFDMEDLLTAALNMDSSLLDYVMTVLDLSTEERLLRERIIGPGDAIKTEWLLRELTHTEACLLARVASMEDHLGLDAPRVYLSAGQDTYDHETGHGWASRSLAGYIGEDGEGGGGGFFLRADLDPGRWSRTDSLCLQLVRQHFHASGGVHSTVAPLLFETPDSQRSGHALLTDLPESYVFASPLTSCNTWVPEDGLLGFTRLQEGLATVLKRWILHTIDTESSECTHSTSGLRFTEWTRTVREAPEACYGAIRDVCAKLFSHDHDEAWIYKRRAILTNLILYQLELFCNPDFHPKMRLGDPKQRWRCAWAVSYIGLGVTCGLLSSLEDQCALLEHARTIPPLEIAMRRAFKATASPMQTR
tara:strand:+ start:122 stop:2668 length:2547 start_codon:yes stop_codon:yes gene_type:complete